MFIFKTELFGLIVEVEGTFSPEEKATIDSPGWPAYFEIETIKHKDEEFEVDSLPAAIHEDIESEAFKAAHDQHDPY